MSNWKQHRERWMRRIRKSELEFKIAEDGIHSVIDYIEDNDLDETIKLKLLDVVDKINSIDKGQFT